MRRCPDCGGFYRGIVCPQPHGDDRDARQPVRDADDVALRQGEWVGYLVTIGRGAAEERMLAPAQVLGVSSRVVRLACYVSDAGRVIFVDAALADLLPPVNPLEETDDGD